MNGTWHETATNGAQGSREGAGAERPQSFSKSRALPRWTAVAPPRAASGPLRPRHPGAGRDPVRSRCDTLEQGLPGVSGWWAARRGGWALRCALALFASLGALHAAAEPPVAAAVPVAAEPPAAGAVPATDASPASAAVPAARCGDPLPLVPLQAGVWLVPGLPAPGGDADPANRGQVANLLVAADGDRLWLVGSGPSPAFGRRLACDLQRQLGRDPTDAIAPWAHPELVLGQAGFDPAVRLHAHRTVAAAMGANCPNCVERLRAQLGAAAADLDGDAVRLPQVLFDGERGRLGPFDWLALDRGDGQVVTLWRLRGTPWLTAHGLLWGDGPPDGRGADLRRLAAASAAAADLAAADPAARWVPEQGPVQPAAAVAAHARYWQGLLGDADEDVASGRTEGSPPPARAGPAEWSQHPRHALNWQRAWRQALDRSLGPPLR